MKVTNLVLLVEKIGMGTKADNGNRQSLKKQRRFITYSTTPPDGF